MSWIPAIVGAAMWTGALLNYLATRRLLRTAREMRADAASDRRHAEVLLEFRQGLQARAKGPVKS